MCSPEAPKHKMKTIQKDYIKFFYNTNCGIIYHDKLNGKHPEIKDESCVCVCIQIEK
jgi:hypothetical protein